MGVVPAVVGDAAPIKHALHTPHTDKHFRVRSGVDKNTLVGGPRELLCH